MMTPAQHQAWLFCMPLAQQAALLKDDLLEPVDQLLEDPQLIELVRNCLAARSPASQRTGRTGIAPDRLLRCCVLKHVKGWSFRAIVGHPEVIVHPAAYDKILPGASGNSRSRQDR